MRWRYQQGWLLFDVSLATLLLMVVVLGSCLSIQRQSMVLHRARATLLAQRLLINGLESLQLVGDTNGARWQAWLAESHARFPHHSARYHCSREVCTLCYYRTSKGVPWQCLRAARPALVSSNSV